MSTYNVHFLGWPLITEALLYTMKSEQHSPTPSPTATMIEEPVSDASHEPKFKIPHDDESSRDAAPSPTQDTLRTEETREFVTWDGPDDPENPKNWSYAYKWWITIIMCILSLAV